ncbi:MAG: MscS Mechanosensitive ion channel [Edaphobacter sp.]|nr:MscS Mechanosensitive ion channel [Edaphobacter sp.]
MKDLRRLLIVVPAVVLVLCLIGSYVTRGSMANLPFLRGKGRVGASPGELVDQRPWQTIEALAPLAVSTEEKRFARDAQRLADHEVDQAFAMALRQASMVTRVLTGESLALQQKMAALQELVKEDQAKVDSLTAAAKAAGPAANTDDLDVAKAQLQLDSDQLGDTGDDLARLSGDKRSEIQQELTAREAAMKKFDTQMGDGGQTAVVSAKRYGTLYGRVGAWFDQRTRLDLIEQAKSQADADVTALTAQHVETEKKLATAGQADAAAQATDGTRGRVARLAQMHSLAQIHGILDDRINTQKQLSAVYGKWIDQVNLQHGIVVHLLLQSIALIAFIGLCGALIGRGLQVMLDRLSIDRRNLHTMRTITSLAVQGVTLLLVLLVVFGTPSQMPTILGLATAGLTVVFQDYILAFCGWFVLMGKTGIRVGDWVEINGVGGEVAEIGLFRTTLLETGNWTDKGHPTGRRVRFINKFAISGQYFNFSTIGQWMWDEIQVSIPQGEDSYKTIEAIHAAVVMETEADTMQAEEEWQRATKYGMSHFSAAPSVDMRPAGTGVDIVVRYVTRAGERLNIRNRLYHVVIDLLHAGKGALVGDGVSS